MKTMELPIKHKDDSVRTLIISSIVIYLTIIVLLLYVTNSAQPFGFLFTAKDYSENIHSTSEKDFKSISNKIQPIGLIAEYIIKNNPEILKRSQEYSISDNDYSTSVATNKNNQNISYINSDTDIDSDTSNSDDDVDLTELQDNIRISKKMAINPGFIFNNKRSIPQYYDKPDSNYQQSTPVSETPTNTLTKQQSNSKIIPATNTQPVITTTVVGNYTNEIPFKPLVKDVPQKSSCPDLITPQMKTRFNFSVLSQMGCNPTFSYN